MKTRTTLNRKCNKCNIDIDDRSKSGLCTSCCKLGKLNPFYNKQHTIVSKQIMKEKAKYRDKSTYHKIVLTVKQRKEHSLKMKELHKSGKYTDSIKKWISAGIKTKKNTKIEQIINSVLIEFNLLENINYKRNYQIDKYNVDFLIYDNVIIECYGDYWHKNPKYYIDEDRWNKDNRKKNFLKKQGYYFKSFWETDIKHNIQNIKNNLQNVCTTLN